MNRPFHVRAALVLLALPLIAGCGNKVTAPSSGMTSTTADDIAVQTVASLGIMGGDVQFAVSTTPPASAARTRRARPALALWDTTFVYGGITYEATRDFYDELDNLLPSYGPTAVRLHWTSRAYGTYEGPRDTASVGHTGVLDVRGIQAGQDTVQFDGACHDTLLSTFRSLDGTRTRYFLWISSSTLDRVRHLKSTLGSVSAPLSGTATFTVSADRLRSNDRADVEAHFDAHVVVLFNGTMQPVIVVDGAFTYHWNMVTGMITRG